jgi:hypothetical protein
MRDRTSSNAKGVFTKPILVKSTLIKASHKMVLLPPVNDLQSSLPLPNRPRLVSLEFHSSPRPLPRMPLLPGSLLKKRVGEHHQVTPDLYIRPKVLDAQTVRALGLAPSLLSPLFHAEHLFLPQQAAALCVDDDMCVTPAPSSETDMWMPGPPSLKKKESSMNMNHILPSSSPTTAMPRKLLVPDDF